MSIYESLLLEIRELPVVDAHEHVGPEKVRLSLKPDVCSLFSHYTVNDLISAGCRPWGITARERYRLIEFLRNTSIPLEERFKVIEPYVKYIKYGTYYKALEIALREVYGYSEVNWNNYREISNKMREENKPGIYDRIFVEKCRAKYVLPQWSEPSYEKEYMRPVIWVNKLAEIKDFTELKMKCREEGFNVRNLDDYLNYIDFKLNDWKKRGVAGLKTVSIPYKEPPPLYKADAVFRNTVIEMIALKAPLYSINISYVSPKGTTHSEEHDEITRRHRLDRHTASAYLIALRGIERHVTIQKATV